NRMQQHDDLLHGGTLAHEADPKWWGERCKQRRLPRAVLGKGRLHPRLQRLALKGFREGIRRTGLHGAGRHRLRVRSREDEDLALGIERSDVRENLQAWHSG